MWLNFLSGKLLTICSTLLVAVSIVAAVLYTQLSKTQDALSLLRAELKEEQRQHAAAVQLFAESVNIQNTAIAELKREGDVKQEQVAKVQQQLAAARREREELIARLRATPTTSLTCTESMELLNDSIPSLMWEPVIRSTK